MTELKALDRVFLFLARYVERPALWAIVPQPVLRTVFALTAPLGSRKLKGTKTDKRSDGSLVITPSGVGADAPVLLYIHGGGFTIGSPRTHLALISHLAKSAGMRAIAARYRLAPEHPFPAALDDCLSLYQRLVAEGCTPVALCGDSAGGCLALQVACHARDAGLPQPKALGLIAPIGDLSGSIASRFENAEDEALIPPAWPRRLIRCYLEGADRASPEVSPLRGSLRGLPPTLLQAATGEALADDTRRISESMDEAELDLWDGLQHVWHLHAGRAPAADLALAHMGAFLADKASQ